MDYRQTFNALRTAVILSADERNREALLDILIDVITSKYGVVIQHKNKSYSIPLCSYQKISDSMKAGRKITAIKELRDNIDLTLIEAKDLAETHFSS